MEDKRGISPLIATLLLIAFTVALGVMIMNWGRNIVPDYESCDSVQIAIDTTPNSLCYLQNTSEVSFLLVNLGKTDIKSIKLVTKDAAAVGSAKVREEVIPDSGIAKGGYYSKAQPFVRPLNFELDFIPIIMVNNQPQVCADKSIKVNAIPDCK